MRALLILAALALLLAPSAARAQPSPSPFTSATRYDAGGRVTGTISADPDGPAGPLPFRAVRNSYDGAGRLILAETGTLASWQSEVIAPADWSGFTVFQSVATTYDAGNRKTSERLHEGSAGPIHGLTQYSYDALGRLECTAVRMNPAAFAAPPASACTLGTQGAFGPDRITRNAHDAAGQLLQVQEAYGTAEQATVATRTYTANGRVETLADGENNRTTYVYDGHDRLFRTRFPSTTQGAGTSSSTDYEELTLDANGNVTNRRLRDGTSLAFTYDALNRLTYRDTPNLVWQDRDNSYTYDNLGHRLSASMEGWGSGWTLSWAYDALGRVTSETSFYGTKLLQYDANGRLSRLTWPDGFYVSYDYLDTGELVHVRENGATSGPSTCSGQAPCVLATYAYDGLGRRTAITRGNGTSTAYAYDGAARLASLSHDLTSAGADLDLTYTHNPAGQIATSAGLYSTYVYVRANGGAADAINGLNQVTQTGGTPLTHDARGNITAIGSTGYAYSPDNRLVAAGGTDLAYDAAGRLAILYTPTQQRLDMLGDQLITELDSSNSITRRYVYAPGALDEPLVWYEGAGTSDRRWLHADERGSIIAISNDSGALSFINAYDEYGRPQNNTIAGRFGYAGQAWLQEFGLSHNRARIYNPALGRFMQTDPIGTEGGINLYQYANGDPANRADPTGLIDLYLRLGDLELSLHAPLIGEWRASVEAPGTSIRTSIGGGNIRASVNAGPVSIDASAGLRTRLSVETPGVTIRLGRLGESTIRVTPDRISAPPRRRGNAPIGDDGRPIELHHEGQRSNGRVREMTFTDHRGGENFRRNHSNTGQERSQIDASERARQRRAHWRREHDSGRFDD